MHPQLIQQLRQMGLNPYQPPEDRATWQNFLQSVDQVYASIEHASLYNPISQPTGGASFMRIVAERDKLRSIFAALSNGLCVFGRQGNLLLINATAKQYLGIEEGTTWQQADVLSRFLLRDQLHPERYMDPDTLMRIVREGVALRDSEARLISADKQLPIACVINPLNKSDRNTGAVLMFHDTSEQQRTAAALLAAKEMAEQSSHAKSDFLSSMSHELRTPMNAILGYGEILEEDLEDPPEGVDEDYIEDLQAYTNHILQAGRNLLTLINEVLDLTKIENREIDLSINRIDLGKTLENCIAKIADNAAARQLSIHNHIIDKTYTVMADAERLEQIIGQVLSNAVKHNKEGGEIHIECSQPAVEKVRLLIRDNGVGMTEEQTKVVFKPFTRISGRNLTKGTGVGLTIAKQLLEIMDGRLGVESELDVGSTFWIELPTGETSEVSRETVAADRRYLLLYIEDSRTNVSLMNKILRERPDIAFISAPTGEMGLELARTHRPDIILLDINLPGINGFEVLKRLRAFPATHDITVLGLSADDSKEALSRAETAGFSSYMIKPLQKKQFLIALEDVLHA